MKRRCSAVTFERLKSVTEQAEQHLKAWGLSKAFVDCEGSDYGFAIKVVGDTKPFTATFALISHDGTMTIDLNPHNHLVIKVDGLTDQDLSLMFALSALSNLLSHKTDWLPLSDATLILSWGYDHTENAWEVEVVAIKDAPHADPPSGFMMTLNIMLKDGRAALRGLLSGDGWDISLKRLGSFNSLMRALVGLVLAFAGSNKQNMLKEASLNDSQGRI
jgi:hypothetical protein